MHVCIYISAEAEAELGLASLVDQEFVKVIYIFPKETYVCAKETYICAYMTEHK